jgi:hypothetical protein
VRTVPCYRCGGYGIHDTWNGDYDIVDCYECGGLGRLTVYKNDALALWPGGPMRGSWPGAYEKAGDA